jgi:TatD DNase family protein
MKFVDAHIHLSDKEYADCVGEVITDAKNANVVSLVSNAVDLKTSVANLRLAEEYPGMVYVALGIHPWNIQALANDEVQQTLEFIRRQKGNKALVALGEIGLDHKYVSCWEKQLEVFNEMLHLAEKTDLPVIIHSRGTTAQIVDMLPSYSLKGVLLHWFSNPTSVLPKAIENGYYITEGAPATYSNGIRDVIKRVPLSNLLTETDGPVHFFRRPFEGKMTTPAIIPAVVKAIAEVKKLDMSGAAEQIVENFECFFSVKLN